MKIYPEVKPKRYAKHYCQVVEEIVPFYREDCPHCQVKGERDG